MNHKCLFIIENNRVKVYQKEEITNQYEVIKFCGEDEFLLTSEAKLWEWILNTLVKDKSDQFDICFLYDDSKIHLTCPYLAIHEYWKIRTVVNLLSKIYENTNIQLKNLKEEVVAEINVMGMEFVEVQTKIFYTSLQPEQVEKKVKPVKDSSEAFSAYYNDLVKELYSENKK